jgi:hypothetical protein
MMKRTTKNLQKLILLIELKKHMLQMYTESAGRTEAAQMALEVVLVLQAVADSAGTSLGIGQSLKPSTGRGRSGLLNA